jgi:hypothetical protein
VADEAVVNKVLKKSKKFPFEKIEFSYAKKNSRLFLGITFGNSNTRCRKRFC